MRIDHIGYAVKDIEKAQKAMGVLGYEFEPVIRDEARNIFISFGKMSGGGIRLSLWRLLVKSPLLTVICRR